MLEQREKQKAIDAMEFEIYEDEEEDGSTYVQFHDFLFACVQRAYKKEDPSLVFCIDDHHKENLRDESRDVLTMSIPMSQYIMARRIAQAFRDHKFRKQFFAMQIDTTESKRPLESKQEWKDRWQAIESEPCRSINIYRI